MKHTNPRVDLGRQRHTTLSARVSTIDLAEIALFLKGQNVVTISKSSIVGDVFAIFVNTLETSNIIRRTITTEDEARLVLAKLGIKVNIPKRQVREIALQVDDTSVTEEIHSLLVDRKELNKNE